MTHHTMQIGRILKATLPVVVVVIALYVLPALLIGRVTP
jgi:hypothetical protein